jgi:hypothetical protein
MTAQPPPKCRNRGVIQQGLVQQACAQLLAAWAAVRLWLYRAVKHGFCRHPTHGGSCVLLLCMREAASNVMTDTLAQVAASVEGGRNAGWTTDTVLGSGRAASPPISPVETHAPAHAHTSHLCAVTPTFVISHSPPSPTQAGPYRMRQQEGCFIHPPGQRHACSHTLFIPCATHTLLFSCSPPPRPRQC